MLLPVLKIIIHFYLFYIMQRTRISILHKLKIEKAVFDHIYIQILINLNII